MAKKKKIGSQRWAFGAMFSLPNPETNEVTTLTFKGSFDRRKLRKMLRKSLNQRNVDTVTLDYIIDTYSVKLKPLSMADMLAAMEAGNAEAITS